MLSASRCSRLLPQTCLLHACVVKCPIYVLPTGLGGAHYSPNTPIPAADVPPNQMYIYSRISAARKHVQKKTKKIIEVSVSCHCSRFVSVQRQTQSFLCNCRPPGCARRMLIVLVQDCKTMFTVPVAFLHSQSLAHALQSCSAKPTCFCRLPAAMGLQVIL